MAAHEELGARLDRQTRRLRAALATGLDRRRTRVHMLSSRRGLAGFPARVAMRGRHTAELTHQLQTAMVAVLTLRNLSYFVILGWCIGALWRKRHRDEAAGDLLPAHAWPFRAAPDAHPIPVRDAVD